MKTIYLTANGEKILDNKIIDHEQKTKDLVRQLGETCKDDPDLPENVLFKEIQLKLYREIPAEKSRLLGMKAAAIIVENTQEFQEKPNDEAWIGSKVTFCNTNDPDYIQTITILGALESDYKNGIISYDAPMARAMIGKKTGDTFNINIEQLQTYQILAVKQTLGQTENKTEI